MTRLLLILILTLNFQALTRAADIRNFEIEGMSVGDSALNYFSKEEIESNKSFIYPNSKKFYSVTFRDINLEVYDGIQFHLKKDDKKYIIYDITGQIYYSDENIDECFKKKDEIFNEISTMFPDAKKKDFGKTKHYNDPTTILSRAIIKLNEGRIDVVCYDWGDYDAKDGLGVGVELQEFRYFINNEAYD